MDFLSEVSLGDHFKMTNCHLLKRSTIFQLLFTEFSETLFSVIIVFARIVSVTPLVFVPLLFPRLLVSNAINLSFVVKKRLLLALQYWAVFTKA